MTTFIALIFAIFAFVGTIVGANYVLGPIAAPLNYDILAALTAVASLVQIDFAIPDPFHQVLAGAGLMVPAVVLFYIIRVFGR